MTIHLDPPHRVLIITKPIRPSGLVRVSPAAVRELAAVIDREWTIGLTTNVAGAGLYEESEKRA